MKNNHTQLKRFAAISLVMVMCLSALPMLAPSASAAAPYESFSEPGYHIQDALIDEDFRSPPADLIIQRSNESRLGYSYGDRGLEIDILEKNGHLYIENTEPAADTVALSLDMREMTPGHQAVLLVKFNTPVSGHFYQLRLDIKDSYMNLRPGYYLGAGSSTPETISVPVQVNAMERTDLLIRMVEGNIVFSINGLEYTLRTDLVVHTNLSVSNITIGSSNALWSAPASLYLSNLQIGNNTTVDYYDGLHKTITPWGYDYTLTMQIHADDASPAKLMLLKELADTYGVRGEFASWVRTANPDKQYSITTSTEYRDALLALQASGWDIGLHAVNDHHTNRTAMLADIALFEQIYGPLRSWVDHGTISQDIYRSGNDPASPYYIADYLDDNEIMIWINQVAHSHSTYEDLNYEGASYTHSGFPGLDLFRVSKSGVLAQFLDWDSNFAPATQDDWDRRLRPYADMRSVLAWHDYTDRYLCVEDGGVLYAHHSHSNAGYPYELITAEEAAAQGANVHPDGTWQIKEPIETMFASMRDSYNVWYATATEVYDRSRLVQNVQFNEAPGYVTLTNYNSVPVEGFTIYTQTEPDYCLKIGSKTYYAVQGAESWAFVIDELPAGTTKLTKRWLPDGAPSVESDSVPMALWSDGARLYMHLLRSGIAHVSTALDADDIRIESADGTIVEDGADEIFYLGDQGVTYVAYSLAAYRSDQIDNAMSPLYAIIPVVVVLAVVGGLFSTLGRIKY